MRYPKDLDVVQVPAKQLRPGHGRRPKGLGKIPPFAAVDPAFLNGAMSLGIKAIQTSEDHGRSSQVPIIDSNGRPAEGFARHEQLFCALDEKGNIWTNICPYYSTGLKRFCIEGLFEKEYVPALVDTSTTLLKGRVETETVLKVVEPTMFWYKGKKMSYEEFKEALIAYVKEKNAPNRTHILNSRIDVSPDQVEGPGGFREYLDTHRFVIAERGHHVAERFSTFSRAENKQEFRRMLSKCFFQLNLRQRHHVDNYGQYLTRDKNQMFLLRIFPDLTAIEEPTEATYQEFWEVEKKEQELIDWYFYEFLPTRIGINVGRMHNMGIVHRFLHAQNISGVGSIYDLDSPKGELLGDKPVGEFIEEGREFFCESDLSDLFNNDGDLALLVSLYELQRKRFLSSGDDKIAMFKTKLIDAYIQERWGESWIEDEAARMHVGKLASKDKDIATFYIKAIDAYLKPRISKELLYEYNFSPEEFMNTFVKIDTAALEIRLEEILTEVKESTDITNLLVTRLKQNQKLPNGRQYYGNVKDRCELFLGNLVGARFREWYKQQRTTLSSDLLELVYLRAAYLALCQLSMERMEKLEKSTNATITKLVQKYDPTLIGIIPFTI